MVVYKFRERQRIIAQHERLFEAIRDGKASLAAKVFAEQMSYRRDLHRRAREWRQKRCRKRRTSPRREERAGATRDMLRETGGPFAGHPT